MTTDPILIELRGASLWIVLNRPDRRNAINAGVLSGIAAGLKRASEDPAVRAIVLTGTGDRAFCAGGDLEGGTEIFASGRDEPATDFGRLARLARDVPVPLVARINGACVAGGMGLMALCDLAVAADHARFGLPEARIGVFPMQVLVWLRTLIAPRHLVELCFTGEPVDAQRAFAIGLVNHVVPQAELDTKLNTVLDMLLAASPAAIRRGKYALAAMEGMSFHEALAFAESQIQLAAQTEDAREGVAAFAQKRNPRWVME